MHCHAKSAIILFLIKYCFTQLLLQEFQSEEIPSEKQDPEFNSPDIRILHLRRRLTEWFICSSVVCVCVSMDCGVVGQMFDTEPYENNCF